MSAHGDCGGRLAEYEWYKGRHNSKRNGWFFFSENLLGVVLSLKQRSDTKVADADYRENWVCFVFRHVLRVECVQSACALGADICM